MKTLLISGFDGRMGQACARLAPEFDFDPLPFSSEAQGDIVLDFSHPDRLDALLSSLRGRPLVIGTTGYSPEQQQQIQAAAQTAPIFCAANFSLGIHVLRQIIQEAQRMLPDWDCTLIERHHRHKKDAPSGTARDMMSDINMAGENVLCLRAGTVRGIHEVGFYGEEEYLQIIHTAESRDVFARGALRAAKWLPNRPNGLYGMNDL